MINISKAGYPHPANLTNTLIQHFSGIFSPDCPCTLVHQPNTLKNWILIPYLRIFFQPNTHLDISFLMHGRSRSSLVTEFF